MEIILFTLEDILLPDGSTFPGIKSVVERYGEVPMRPKMREKYLHNYNLIVSKINEINIFRKEKLFGIKLPPEYVSDWDIFKENYGVVRPEVYDKIKEMEILIADTDDIKLLAEHKSKLKFIQENRWYCGNDEKGEFKQIKSAGNFDYDNDNGEVEALKIGIEKKWSKLYKMMQHNIEVELDDDDLQSLKDYKEESKKVFAEIDEYLNTKCDFDFEKCYESELPSIYSPAQEGICNDNIIRDIFFHPSVIQANEFAKRELAKQKHLEVVQSIEAPKHKTRGLKK